MAKSRRWRKIRRVLLRLSGLALVGTLGAGWYVYDYPRLAADLPEAALAYRDAGLPWTAKDLAPNPPVKPDDNAATLLHEAMKAWPHSRTKDGEWSFSDRLFDAHAYGNPLKPILLPLERSLALVHRAARKPRLDLQRDWDRESEMAFVEGDFARRAANALVARAELRALGGDDAGALRDLGDAERLGEILEAGPDERSVRNGSACEIVAMRGAQVSLVLAAKDAERLVHYRAWLVRPSTVIDGHHAYRTAAYETVALLRNIDRTKIKDTIPFCDMVDYGAGDVPDLSFAPRRAVPKRDGLPTDVRDRAYLTYAMKRWTELANATHGLTDPLDRIAQEADRIEGEADFRIVPLTHQFEGCLFSPPWGFLRLNARVMANRTLALLYADALLQHARTGTWPTSSTVPDPLGEGTFKVRTDPDGRFRIWSVGENGVDDGGFDRTELTNSRKSSDDLVAAYPPIPRRCSKRSPPSKGPALGPRGD